MIKQFECNANVGHFLLGRTNKKLTPKGYKHGFIIGSYFLVFISLQSPIQLFLCQKAFFCCWGTQMKMVFVAVS